MKVNHCIEIDPSLKHILSQLNSVHIPKFIKINFSIIMPWTPRAADSSALYRYLVSSVIGCIILEDTPICQIYQYKI
jgi:hypothetical protein